MENMSLGFNRFLYKINFYEIAYALKKAHFLYPTTLYSLERIILLFRRIVKKSSQTGM